MAQFRRRLSAGVKIADLTGVGSRHRTTGRSARARTASRIASLACWAAAACLAVPMSSASASSSELALSGDLASYDGAYLAPEEYQLTIQASVDASQAAVRISHGDAVLATRPLSCDGQSCSVSDDVSVPLASLPAGPAQLAVEVVADGVTVQRRALDIQVDRSGPALHLSGTLREAGATNESLSGDSYELEITALDAGLGDSGPFQVEVSVDGWQAALYDSKCSPRRCAMNERFVYRNGAFGQGAHTVLVTATDGVGHRSSETFKVQDATIASECTGGATVTSGGQPCAPDYSPCTDQRGSLGRPGHDSHTSEDALALAQAAQPDLFQANRAERLDGHTVDPALESDDDALVLNQAQSSAAVSKAADGGMALGLGHGAPCAVPDGTSPGADAPVLSGDTAVYGETEPGTDTLIRPVSAGFELFKEIRNSGAPEEFSWTVKLLDGQSLQQLDEHTVAVASTTSHQARNGLEAAAGDGTTVDDPGDVGGQVDAAQALQRTAEKASGAPVRAVVTADWARDANGKQVPVTVRAAGDRVTMTVKHRSTGIAYPLLVDPTFLNYYVVRTTTYNILANSAPRAAYGYPAFDAATIGNNLARAYSQSWRVDCTGQQIDPDSCEDLVVGIQEACSEVMGAVTSQMALWGLHMRISGLAPVHKYDSSTNCHSGMVTLTPSYYAASTGSSCIINQTENTGATCTTGGSPPDSTTNYARLQPTTISFPGVTLRVFNAHLRHPNPPQAIWTYENVASIVGSDPLSWKKVILGDFNLPHHLTNCWNIAPSAGTLLQRYYQTMGLTEVDNSSGNRDTATSRRVPCQLSQPKQPVLGPITSMAKLDYIFVAPGIPVSDVTVRTEDAHSDHWPLSATLAVPKN